jgi:hypothetical protein
MEFIESISIMNKQTLCINMGSDYIMITYAGTVDHIKRFIWNDLGITEGGASLNSLLLTLDELKERLEDLTTGEPNGIINEYLKFK